MSNTNGKANAKKATKMKNTKNLDAKSGSSRNQGRNAQRRVTGKSSLPQPGVGKSAPLKNMRTSKLMAMFSSFGGYAYSESSGDVSYSSVPGATSMLYASAPPRVSQTQTGVRVGHRTYLGTLVAFEDGAGSVPYFAPEFHLNPGLSATFGALADMFKNAIWWMPNYVTVEVTPIKGADIDGNVVIAFDPDPDNNAPADKAELMSLPIIVEGSIRNPLSLKLTRNDMNPIGTWREVRSAGLVGSALNIDGGVLYVLATNTDVGVQTLAVSEIWLSFDLEVRGLRPIRETLEPGGMLVVGLTDGFNQSITGNAPVNFTTPQINTLNSTLQPGPERRWSVGTGSYEIEVFTEGNNDENTPANWTNMCTIIQDENGNLRSTDNLNNNTYNGNRTTSSLKYYLTVAEGVTKYIGVFASMTSNTALINAALMASNTLMVIRRLSDYGSNIPPVLPAAAYAMIAEGKRTRDLDAERKRAVEDAKNNWYLQLAGKQTLVQSVDSERMAMGLAPVPEEKSSLGDFVKLGSAAGTKEDQLNEIRELIRMRTALLAAGAPGAAASEGASSFSE